MTTNPQSVTDIARSIGFINNGDKLTGARRRQITDALRNRPDVGIVQQNRRGQKATLYHLLESS